MLNTEKANLILQELYKFRHEANPLPVKKICLDANIPTDSETELMDLAKGLENEGYANLRLVAFKPFLRITPNGINYVESNN
ncbi:MAG: hypothetical protein KF862_16410 [Chitinophagaceae bacterium]|jgi:hypothetical protein|nr:hypothetical protein [Chitinophagaceae bacterium]